MTFFKAPVFTRIRKHRGYFLLPLLVIASSVFSLGAGRGALAQPANGTQTLVFLRHAEKPDMGLGQLNCQGLNRAIDLSELLPKEFGKADFIFAANPSRHVEEGAGDKSYSYLRPLMTVGPSAIKLGLPINIDYDANDTSDLAEELLRDKYHDSTIYTAWSHGYLPELVNKVAQEASGNKVKLVQDWTGDDFDSVLVLTLKWVNGKASLQYENYKQGLNNGPVGCPT